MDAIKSALFEDPLYIYIALAIAQIALAALWHESRTRKLALLLLLPPLLAAGVWLLSTLVVTDRERIIAQSQEILSDIQDESSDALEEYLDARFTGRYEGKQIDKAAAIALCKSEKTRRMVRKAVLGKSEVEVHGKQATMSARTRMTAGDAAVGEFPIGITFNLTWVQRPYGWRILTAEEPIMNRP